MLHFATPISCFKYRKRTSKFCSRFSLYYIIRNDIIWKRSCKIQQRIKVPRHSMNPRCMLEIKNDHCILENIRWSLTVPSIWEYTNSIRKWHYHLNIYGENTDTKKLIHSQKSWVILLMNIHKPNPSCMTSANKRCTIFGRRWWKLVSIFYK